MNLAHTVGDDPERVLENHRIIGGAIGIAAEDMVLAWQTHTVNVMKVDDTYRGMGIVKDRPYRDVDGMMTALNVWTCNPVARSFYESLGFVHLKTEMEVIL